MLEFTLVFMSMSLVVLLVVGGFIGGFLTGNWMMKKVHEKTGYWTLSFLACLATMLMVYYFLSLIIIGIFYLSWF